MKRLLLTILLIAVIQKNFSQTIQSHKHIENDSIFIDFINPYLAPIEMNLSPKDSTKKYIKVKNYSVLKYNETLNNAVVIPIKKVKDTAKINISKFINFTMNFGLSTAIIDKNYKYHLPYPTGKSYKIIQSFGGDFSHYRTNSKFAIDFGLKIGDTITAARPGIVFYIKEDSKEYCGSLKCNDKANNILVLHDDGSIAHYVHLNYNGVLVEVGDTIKLDQPIGISGMTGFTTIPHLRFVIYKASKSIPFYFKGQKTKMLKKGWSYRRVY